MRQTALLFGLLLLGACGQSGQKSTVDLLHQRLHANLADAAQAGAVTIQDRPDGAEIVFADAGKPYSPDARTSMVEALIAPALLRIGIAAPAGLSPYEVLVGLRLRLPRRYRHAGGDFVDDRIYG